MRRITLLRHAKSDWNSPTRSDFDRPLNDRGQRDAPRMGQQLLKRGLHPQLVLSSPAVRAITTARIVAAQLGCSASAIQTVDALYLASPKQILQVLNKHAAKQTDVLLVGHNPGLTDLANLICDARIDNLPTCGAFSVELHAGDWSTIGNGAGKLAWFDYPKGIATPDEVRQSGSD